MSDYGTVAWSDSKWHHRPSLAEAPCRAVVLRVSNSYGNSLWKADPTISPLRGALATWGLTIDDLGVASFHGTSMQLNDKNEVHIIQLQLTHLGRAKGNPLLGVFQKYLTGHPKSGAAAWMLSGGLQILDSGLVPGNRNADNIDERFREHSSIVFSSRSIQTDGVKAVSVTSFGFGQKGAQAICVHPKYLLATISESSFNKYSAKIQKRRTKANGFFDRAMCTGSMLVPKDKAHYQDWQLESFLTDSSSRLCSSS